MNILKLFLPHFLMTNRKKRIVNMIIEYNNETKTIFEYQVLRKILGVNVCCVHNSIRDAIRYQTAGNKIEKVKITVEGNLL